MAGPGGPRPGDRRSLMVAWTLCYVLLGQEVSLEGLLRSSLSDLGHRRYAVRERAMKVLRDLGERARPRLEAHRSLDLEVAQRVKVLLGPWEAERLWKRSGEIGPSR